MTLTGDRLDSATNPDGAPPKRRRRPRWWVEVLAIAWLLWIYDWLTNLAPVRLSIAVQHGYSILHLEQRLHLDPEHALDHWLSHHHTLGLAVSDFYDNAHFVVTLGVVAWLWWRHPDVYPRLRSSLVLTNLIAFVIFWLYPLAPPRMLHGFVDVVAQVGGFGSWHSGTLASHADQVAAMPSLHLGWAVWSAWAIFVALKGHRGRGLAFVYPVLTSVAVLTTGNHYLADVLAGILTAIVAILAAEYLHRLWGRRGSRTARPAPASAP
jgi:hypothetical protein